MTYLVSISLVSYVDPACFPRFPPPPQLRLATIPTSCLHGKKKSDLLNKSYSLDPQLIEMKLFTPSAKPERGDEP